VTLLGAILGAIESLTCGTTDMWVPYVSDSMAPRMAPSNVTESESVSLGHFRTHTRTQEAHK
jgi:hypothetical protein